MATKKKLLQAAAGSAGGAGGLNVEQVFSTYLYEGNGSAQVIENGINLGQSNGSGSVELSSNYIDISSSISLSGDFTLEAWVWLDKSSYAVIIGNSSLSPNVQFGINSSQQVYITDPTELVSSGTINLREWTHVAVSRSGSTVYYFINGTASGTQTSSATLTYQQIGTVADVYNMWEGYISDLRIVSGTALYTSSFTAPTSPLTAVTGTQLLACQGDSPLTDNSSNGYTLTAQDNAKASSFGPFDAASAGEGGMVWIKQRTNAYGHYLYDTERGVQKGIASDSTAVEQTGRTGVTSFNSNGFSLGNFTYENGSGNDIASWTFRKAPKFFTCLTYTGTGDTTTQTISHDLGAVPGCIIVKRTDSADNWRVYHRGVDVNGDSQPWTDMLTLNSTNAASDFPVWGDTAPTSTEFTVGYESSVNASGGTYVAYLFAHNDGDGEFGSTADQDIIKCGSYTGNGSSTGPVIDLGFEPQWLLIKGTSSTDSWAIFDVMRGMTVGASDSYLFPNSSGAELSYSSIVKPTPTGFQLESVNWNTNSNNYIYIAIRRGPMAVPTAATDVFAIQDGRLSTVPQFSSGFAVDMAINRYLPSSSNPHEINARLTGNQTLDTSATSSEVTRTNVSFDFMDGYYEQATPATADHIAWMWKRAPNFFDVVAYDGTGAAQNITHNLGVVPEMMWIRERSNDAASWYVWHSSFSANDYIWLNFNNGKFVNSAYFPSVPTDTQFSVGTSDDISGSGDKYIAYLFASLDGVSKVGSYVGDNVNGRVIDCGFTNGARFVLIKKAIGGTGNWQVFDTERGIVTGNDPRLELDTTSAELTGFDFIDPSGSGFALTNRDDTNETGHTYIFYAVSA